MAALLDRVRDGRAGGLFVVGEAGVGLLELLRLVGQPLGLTAGDSQGSQVLASPTTEGSTV